MPLPADLDHEIVKLALRVVQGDETAVESFIMGVPPGYFDADLPLKSAAYSYLKDVKGMAPVYRRSMEADRNEPGTSDQLARIRGTDLYKDAYKSFYDGYSQPMSDTDRRRTAGKQAPETRRDLSGDQWSLEYTDQGMKHQEPGASPGSSALKGDALSQHTTADTIYKLARVEAAESAADEAIRVENKASAPEKSPKEPKKPEVESVAGMVTAGVP
jgi:hypothetical protein